VYEIQIGALRLQPDTVTVLQREETAEATTYPIESGASRADHTVVRPLRLVLTAVFSTLPLDAAVQIPEPGDARPETARALLTEALQSRQTVTLYTPREVIGDLVLEGVSAQYDRETGSALPLRLSLLQVRSVSSQTVEIPPARRAASVRPSSTVRDAGTFAQLDPSLSALARASVTGSVGTYVGLTGSPGAAVALARLLGTGG